MLDSDSYHALARAASVGERQSLFRRTMRRPGHHGARQLAGVVLVSLTPALVALLLVDSWGPRQLLVGLTGLGVGASIVYFGHRYPMHHPWPGIGWVYDVHTRCHHLMFDEGKTEITSLRDVDMIMFPVRDAAGMCAVVVPVLAAPWLWLGLDAFLVFAAVCWLYYLAYELVHLASHGPIGGSLDRVPGLGWLLRHHRRHHAWSLMHHGNFSMVIPLWDVLLGTRLPPRKPSS